MSQKNKFCKTNFCKDCLKESKRIDDDGAEYYNSRDYYQVFEKHHPRIEAHQP